MINNIFQGNPGTKGKKFLGGDYVSRLFETNNRQNYRFLFYATPVVCTVTKSEPNEASLWKITLQKRGNPHVDTGTFVPPLTRLLYILLCGKSVPVYGREHITGPRR
jgi:hypothetical protein